MTILVLIIISVYAFVLLVFTVKWNRLVTNVPNCAENLTVTILIPFRNEANRIAIVLDSLTKLQYDSSKLQILLLNDHSTDDSINIVENYLDSIPYEVELISLPSGMKGKKAAIELGVSKAKFPIILTTDADCNLPADWVEKMQKPFLDAQVKLVSGSVYYHANSLWTSILQTEFAAYIGVGGLTISKNPLMLNGANLAYRKQVFEALKPYEGKRQIAGGDDVFLAYSISTNYPDSIKFCKNSKVGTEAPVNLGELFRQRIRWGKKWNASASLASKLVAIGVWMFHLLLLLFLIVASIHGLFEPLLYVLSVKFIAEYLFLSSILRSQNQVFKGSAFFILQIVYSFYVLLIGIFSNFADVKWKERRYG